MSIYKKLFEAKKEIGKISKDSTNPFFKSKYFDINALLEHVEPILQKHGLLLLQPIKDNVVYSIIADVENCTGLNSGSDCVVSGISLTDITDPQKRGSEITYYRRYTLQSLLGLQAEDDDANSVSGNNISKQDEDTRPWLDEKGLSFLEIEGTKEQLLQAIAGRRMKKVFRERIDIKLKKL